MVKGFLETNTATTTLFQLLADHQSGRDKSVLVQSQASAAHIPGYGIVSHHLSAVSGETIRTDGVHRMTNASNTEDQNTFINTNSIFS